MDKLDLTLHTLLKKASEKAPDPMPKDASDAVLHTLTSLPDTPPCIEKRKASKVCKIIAAAAAAAAIFVALPNISPGISHAIEDIPIIGAMVKAVTFRSYTAGNDKIDIDANVPLLKGSDFIANGVLDGVNQEIQEITDRLIQRYVDDINGGADWHESLQIDYDVMTDTDEWFTLRLSLYEGAGSGMQYYKFYTLNKRTGDLCTLADLFTDNTYIKRVSEEIRRQMQMQMEEDPTCTYWVDNEIEDWNFEAIAPDQHFYFNDAGNLVLVFDKYTVAPGYMGTPEFEIQRELFADILKS